MDELTDTPMTSNGIASGPEVQQPDIAPLRGEGPITRNDECADIGAEAVASVLSDWA